MIQRKRTRYLEAVLFDLDGTLVGTRSEYRYKVVGATLKELRRQAIDTEMDAFWFGVNRDAIIRERFDLDPILFWRVFAERDLPTLRAEHTVPFGDVAVLRKLREQGLRLGVVTNAPYHIAEAELTLLGGDDLFDTVVVADLARGIRPKPMPDGIVACLNALGTRPQNACFVGNAREDIEAAKAAGVKDIYIDRKEHPLADGDTIPTLSIVNLDDLFPLIQR